MKKFHKHLRFFRFMTKRELKKYNHMYVNEELVDQKSDLSNLILSQHFKRPFGFSRKIIGNDNVFIVGEEGTGVNNHYLKPNILQMNASYIILNRSDEICSSIGKVLKDNGYTIKILNILDIEHSNCYNPLKYIQDEADVNILIECIIKNTVKGGALGDETLLEAAKYLLSACIFYLIYHIEDESKRNFSSVNSIFFSSSLEDTKSLLEKLFTELPKDSLARKYYEDFKRIAGKAVGYVIHSCVILLQPFHIPQVKTLTKTDTLELEKVGDEKTALFIVASQHNYALTFLEALLCTQLCRVLVSQSEQQKVHGKTDEKRIPVHFMLNELPDCGCIPDLPSKLSTYRCYNISFSVVVQTINQLKKIYKDEWKTFIGNCSTILYLGSHDSDTISYFAQLLNYIPLRKRNLTQSKAKEKKYQIIRKNLFCLPVEKCIVFSMNMKPVFDNKYPYEIHPKYRFTADWNKEYDFYKEDRICYLKNENATDVEKQMYFYMGLYLVKKRENTFVYAPVYDDNHDRKNFPENIKIKNRYVDHKSKIVFDCASETVNLSDCYYNLDALNFICERSKELGFKAYFGKNSNSRRKIYE